MPEIASNRNRWAKQTGLTALILSLIAIGACQSRGKTSTQAEEPAPILNSEKIAGTFYILQFSPEMFFSVTPKINGQPCKVKMEVLQRTYSIAKTMMESTFEKVVPVTTSANIPSPDGELVIIQSSRFDSDAKCNGSNCVFSMEVELRMALYKKDQKHTVRMIRKPGHAKVRVRSCQSIRNAFDTAATRSIKASAHELRLQLIEKYGSTL